VTPEFSRPQRIDAIGDREQSIEIEADAAERAALAQRFGLLAVEALSAALTLKREAAGIVVRGRVRGRVRQACVVTDAPIESEIDEPLALRFVDGEPGQTEEVELDAADLDDVPLEGGAIDLGEAVAETMALALDPFPRAPGAEAALRAAGVLSEEEARPGNPFAALKDALGKSRDMD
jgi:uncharacterized metal-binding protein YceD (DUF177 family)